MTEDPESTFTLHMECYVGIVPSRKLDDLVDELRSLEVEDKAIDAFCGDATQEEYRALSPHRIDESGWKWLVRQVLGFDQVEVERDYLRALESGAPVIRVRVPEDDASTRADVEEALLEHDARFIHYFGRWSFVEVASDAERVDRAG